MKNTLAYLRNLQKKLPTILGNEAVNFFQDNIKQGIDATGKPFQKRWGNFGRNSGRTVLTQSGNLRRSIRVVSLTPNKVTIGSNLPYANVQNKGAKLEITPKMRKFFWAKYFEARGKADKYEDSTRDSDIRKAKTINAEAKAWRSLLSKKKTHINIPQRMFAAGGQRLQERLKKALDKL